MGCTIDAFSGAVNNASEICAQEKSEKTTTKITTNMMLQNIPCKKSVTITAIWPPIKVKNRAKASNTTIIIA